MQSRKNGSLLDLCDSLFGMCELQKFGLTKSRLKFNLLSLIRPSSKENTRGYKSPWLASSKYIGSGIFLRKPRIILSNHTINVSKAKRDIKKGTKRERKCIVQKPFIRISIPTIPRHILLLEIHTQVPLKISQEDGRRSNLLTKDALKMQRMDFSSRLSITQNVHRSGRGVL